MIVSIEKDGEDVISSIDIKYTYVNGYIYNIPFIIEIGANEHLLEEDKFVLGKLYKAITRYGEEIDLVLSSIEPNSNTVSNTNYTAYKFMHEESYNLLHNLYHPTHKVFGISLEKYIIGSKNQLKIALFELRKKGLHLAVDENYKIVQKQVKEYESAEHKYIIEQVTAQKVHSHSQRKNYSSIEHDGTLTQTDKGHDRPQYIPSITKNEIKGLNLFIAPKIIVQSDHENAQLLLGGEATYKNIKYCIIEKNTIFIKNSVKSVITLGSL